MTLIRDAIRETPMTSLPRPLKRGEASPVGGKGLLTGKMVVSASTFDVTVTPPKGVKFERRLTAFFAHPP